MSLHSSEKVLDLKLIHFFRKVSVPVSRIALFVIFFWFGFNPSQVPSGFFSETALTLLCAPLVLLPVCALEITKLTGPKAKAKQMLARKGFRLDGIRSGLDYLL